MVRSQATTPKGKLHCGMVIKSARGFRQASSPALDYGDLIGRTYAE